MFAVRYRDGATRWRYAPERTSGHVEEDFAIGGVIGSPALGRAGGRVAIFVTTAISTPDPSVADDPGRMLSLHALDAATGVILWRQALTRQSYGHPTWANGVVFVPSTVGLSVQAFRADTGLPLWSSPPQDGPGGIWSFRLPVPG